MKKLKCHCGSVEAEINVDGDLEKIVKCNCSLCKRRGQLCRWLKMKILKLPKEKIN
jgi:hypothetical protein